MAIGLDRLDRLDGVARYVRFGRYNRIKFRAQLIVYSLAHSGTYRKSADQSNLFPLDFLISSL